MAKFRTPKILFPNSKTEAKEMAKKARELGYTYETRKTKAGYWLYLTGKQRKR